MANKQKASEFIATKYESGNHREKEALEYLRKHKVVQMLDNLTSQLIFERPDDPKTYIVEQLEKLMKTRSVHVDPPCVFNQLNIESAFQMLEPTGKGMISLDQYRAGLLTLGVEDFDTRPAGGEVDKISVDTFTREAKRCVSHSTAWVYMKSQGEPEDTVCYEDIVYYEGRPSIL